MIVGKLQRRLFGISPRETEFERRGFRAANPVTRARLEESGAAFVHGYNAGLECDDLRALVQRIDALDHSLHGFAYEGAGMALALLDVLTPWRRNRLRAYLAGPGDAHAYMVHVGAGWALARLRRNLDRALPRFDPLLRWLVVDGYGFHQVFFAPKKYVAGQAHERGLHGYARRAFDFGLGRALWFVFGGDVKEIPRVIARFDALRQADIWCGVGLACTYAGGVEENDVNTLLRAASGFEVVLAQGAAFAAKARERAGNMTPHTELVCRVFCGTSATAAARVTDDALVGLHERDQPAFETWRLRIQQRFAVQEARA